MKFRVIPHAVGNLQYMLLKSAGKSRKSKHGDEKNIWKMSDQNFFKFNRYYTFTDLRISINSNNNNKKNWEKHIIKILKSNHRTKTSQREQKWEQQISPWKRGKREDSRATSIKYWKGKKPTDLEFSARQKYLSKMDGK